VSRTAGEPRGVRLSTTLPAVQRRLRVGRIGESLVRADAEPKVRGEFAYSSDLRAPGMLWGHTLRSPHSHALVRSVDPSGALGLPGVHAVLTHEDVPGAKAYGLEFADQPVLAIDRVRYFGEPVALVAADHPEQARRAAAAIRVEYEALEPVTDMELATDGPDLHPERPTHGHGYRDDPRPNVVRSIVIRHGDPAARGEVSVEGVYETGIQDQAFLGPESGGAVPPRAGGGGRSARRGGSPSPTARAASTSTSRRSGSTSTARRWRRAWGCGRSRSASTSPASAGRSAGERTSRCRSTQRCSRSTRAGR